MGLVMGIIVIGGNFFFFVIVLLYILKLICNWGLVGLILSFIISIIRLMVIIGRSMELVNVC